MKSYIQTVTNEMTYIFVLSLAAFLLAMFLTPIYTFFAYRYQFWKRQRTSAVTGEKLQVFDKLHGWHHWCSFYHLDHHALQPGPQANLVAAGGFCWWRSCGADR